MEDGFVKPVTPGVDVIPKQNLPPAACTNQVVRFSLDVTLRTAEGVAFLAEKIAKTAGIIVSAAVAADSALLIFNSGFGLGILNGCDPGVPLTTSLLSGCGRSFFSRFSLLWEKFPSSQKIHVIATGQLLIALSIYFVGSITARLFRHIEASARALNNRYCAPSFTPLDDI